MKTPIIDLHTCIQGEGVLAGAPHILVRTAGCNLRCMFGNSACDTPYSSFHPEKSRYVFQDLVDMATKNPQIKNILITGGEPFLHPNFIKEILDNFGHHFVTVETNGTIYPGLALSELIDLVSISPKLASSVPTKEKAEILGLPYSEESELRHREKIQDLDDIAHWLFAAQEYQLKYVINNEEDIQEVCQQIDSLKRVVGKLPSSKIFLMPAGIINEQLQEKRQWLMERCIELGFNYTDRLQILAYGDKRGV